jgi:hypothetical protein
MRSSSPNHRPAALTRVVTVGLRRWKRGRNPRMRPSVKVPNGRWFAGSGNLIRWWCEGCCGQPGCAEVSLRAPESEEEVKDYPLVRAANVAGNMSP